MIDLEQINQKKSSKFIGKRIFVYDSIDSTNFEASRLISQSLAAHGDLILARIQTGGRGQFDHSWSSPLGNLYSSFITSSKVSPNSHLITFVAGIACVDAVKKLTGIDVKLKWVNDIIYKGQKLGGILTESVTSGNISTHVTGIGLNVNTAVSASGAKLPPVSFSEIIGNEISLNDLVAELCGSFETYFDIYQKEPLEILKKWVSLADIQGRKVIFDEGKKTGVISGIDYDGYLTVFVDREKYTIMSSKDIEIDYSDLLC